MLRQFFEIRPDIDNMWLFSLVFFILNIGLIMLFPKYNLRKFIEMPFSGKYLTINKISFYLFFVFSIFVPARLNGFFFFPGIILFVSGLILYTVSLYYFAISEYRKPVTEGIYKYFGHPVYLSFFIVILGMILISLSGILFIIATIHFLSLIFVIKEEEKFCMKKYGNDYFNYRKKQKNSYKNNIKYR